MIKEALTFDDVLLQPAESHLGPNEANIETKIDNSINLKIPLISAAMDTVTEHKLAIAMSQLGGLGVIHKNFSVDAQVEEVRKVKKASPLDLRLPQVIEEKNHEEDPEN